MTKNEVIANARKEGRTYLTEIESKQLLKDVGIGTTEIKLAKSKEEAISVGKEMGYPVVLKIHSPDIIHKSDVGGVKLGLTGEDQIAGAYDEIIASVKQKEPKAIIEGISVQHMARPGVEVIMGMSKDPQFGPVLMFGLGGILVEILKDVSFRIVPLTRRDANQMITEIKAIPCLKGIEGRSQPMFPCWKRCY